MSTEIRHSLGQSVDAACEILGHCTALDRLDTHSLQCLGEPAHRHRLEEEKGSNLSYRTCLLLNEVRVAVKFPTMLQASGPGKNAGDGVGAGRSSLKTQEGSANEIYIYIYFSTMAQSNTSDNNDFVLLPPPLSKPTEA